MAGGSSVAIRAITAICGRVAVLPVAALEAATVSRSGLPLMRGQEALQRHLLISNTHSGRGSGREAIMKRHGDVQRSVRP